MSSECLFKAGSSNCHWLKQEQKLEVKKNLMNMNIQMYADGDKEYDNGKSFKRRACAPRVA